MKACTFVPIVFAAVAAAFPALEVKGKGSVVKVTHREGLQFLEGTGVTIASPGGCSDKRQAKCTSLDDIWFFTLEGVVDLSKRCKTPIVITGGTEVGHPAATLSHATGNTVDLQPNPVLDACIRTFRPLRIEGGNEAYRREAATFVNLQTSWDATFESP